MENAMKSVNVSRTYDGTQIVDEVVSSERKAWIYKTLKGVVAFKLFGGEVDGNLADELVSRQYERLMRKPVGTAFPKGLPESDAQWTAYLLRDGNWLVLNHLKKQWRHPTESLDAKASRGDGDDDDTATLVDLIADDGESGFRPWIRKPDTLKTPEAQVELRHIRRAFGMLTKSNTKEKREILRELFLEEREVEEVCARHNLTANALYAIRFRFNEALRLRGPGILEMLEAAA